MILIWNDDEINHDQLIIDSLSTSVLKYNGWKPYVSKEEIEFFKKGRIGNDEIQLFQCHVHIANTEAITRMWK